MALIVGLTGGIGSGKSTFTKALIALGAKVVDADQVAREVVAPGEPALQEIASYFGQSLINAEGQLERAKLREIIFQSADKKQWLNTLLHPIIRERMLYQLSHHSESPYSVLEAPLLFENDLTALTHFNVVVDIPVEIQIQRAMQRDGNTKQQIQAIIDAQIDREQRIQKADWIIDNSSIDRTRLNEQAKDLHQHLLTML